MILRATVGLFAAHCPHCKSIDFRAVAPETPWREPVIGCSSRIDAVFVDSISSCADGRFPSAARYDAKEFVNANVRRSPE